MHVSPLLVADDLGATPDQNRATLAHAHALDGTSLLANGPAFADAIARLRDAPPLPVGAHLDITEHPPLTRNPLLAPLYQQARRNIRPRITSPRLFRAVLAEWHAQVERIAEHIPVKHIDTHRHIHWESSFFLMFLALQQQLKLPRVRGITRFGPSDPTGLRTIKRNIKADTFNTLLRHTGAQVTDDTGSLGACIKAGCITGSVEIILHLGHPDYGADWEWLTHVAMRKAASDPRKRLI